MDEALRDAYVQACVELEAACEALKAAKARLQAARDRCAGIEAELKMTGLSQAPFPELPCESTRSRYGPAPVEPKTKD
ncbi:hypothetical protein KPL78_18240 [Roseomonas sp. HJA6]|uniref:Uncharacterized protein n=1 Tax=Roseomonas alba TaxID=2846776 RepID=A0ABS7ABX7_9PROT|nr:hypothetical protein [Neoroseomonas alba]MBW6399804.1 hypothetical protein [Neoroseomonas alba]